MPNNHHRLSRRSAIVILLGTSGATLLTACGPAAPQAAQAPAPTQPAQAAGAAKPVAAVTSVSEQATAQPQSVKTGGTLRWGQVGDLITIDGVYWAPTQNNTLGQVNEMLIDYDDDLKIMPGLAESWDLSTDNTSIKLNLRKGVQFHTGREFTSDDVEYNVALEAGTLDAADLVPIPDADRLRNDSKFKLYQTHDLGQYFYATVNCGVAPTDNKLVRQAISSSIDRQRFTVTVMKGFTGEPRALPWAKSSPAFDAEKNKAYAFDLDKAKSLFAMSGLSDIQFDISWSLAGYAAEYEQLATIIQGDLAKIGVKTNLKPTDPPAFTQAGQGNNPPFNGMRLSAGAFTQLSEAGSEFALSRTYGYASNGAGFYDDQWTKLASGVATEPDLAERKQLYTQINDYLLDQAFTMAITPYPDIVALRPNVMDMKYFLSTATNDRNIWLS